MSVRRLAPPEQQPKEFSFTTENLAWAKQQIAKYPEGRQHSAVIPLLWRAQAQPAAGCRKPPSATSPTCSAWRISAGSKSPPSTPCSICQPVGKAHVQLCGTTPCRLRGADDLEKVCRKRIGDQGDVSADGKFSWVEVECLGACVNAPMVQIGSDYLRGL